jgi:predicted transcriptional regulator
MERNAHTNDPQTSFDAAASMWDQAPKLRALVLSILRHHGPLAAEQIASHARLDLVTVARRCSDLKRDGAITVYAQGGHTNASGRRADILAVAA